MFSGISMESKKLNIYQMIIGSCLLAVIVILVVLVVGQRTRFNDYSENEYKYEFYDYGWKQVTEEGLVDIESLPTKLETTDYKYVIVNTLPDEIDEGSWLCVTGYISIVKVFIDDELRTFYFLPPGDKGFGSKTSPSAHIFTRLYKKDAGSQIVIEVESQSMFQGWMSNVIIGSQGGIWGYFAHNSMISTMMTLVLGSISIITIVLATYFAIVTRKASGVLYLAIGIFFVCMWRIGSTPSSNTFMQYEVANLTYFFEIACQTLVFVPVPFLLFSDCLHDGRYKIVYKVLEIISIIYAVVVSCLHYSGIVYFAGTLTYTFVVILLALSCVLIITIVEILSGRMKDYRMVVIGLMIFMMLMAFELIKEFADIAAVSSIVYVIGLMILLISVVAEAVVGMLRAHSQKIIAVTAAAKKSEFLSLMSHRIRTPLNTISGMSEMIERETKSQDIKAYASSIRNAVRMLMSLINDMLDVEKSEKGVKLELKEYNLAPLLVDCISLLMSRATQEGLEFVTKVDGQLPSVLYGDAVRIMQIITNVLTNAIKYTNKGTVTLVADKEYIKGQFNLCITVNDTGIGIKEEDIGQIFNSYNRADEKENRHIEGTGLGLSITKKLVDAMKGNISVESEYGKGSSFKIVIPQKIINSEPIGNLEEAIKKYTLKNVSYHERLHAPYAKVLVVDDNKMNIEVFKGLLKQTQIKIDSADSGNQAYEMALGVQYDLIFMDHMMPEPDGIQTLHLLRNNYMAKSYFTPVIALTANATPGAKDMYLKEGFAEYLSKPIDSKKLEKLLLQFLPKEKVVLQ